MTRNCRISISNRLPVQTTVTPTGLKLTLKF